MAAERIVAPARRTAVVVDTMAAESIAVADTMAAVATIGAATTAVSALASEFPTGTAMAMALLITMRPRRAATAMRYGNWIPTACAVTPYGYGY